MLVRNILGYDDLLSSTQITIAEGYFNNLIKANSIQNSTQSLPPQPPFITQSDLDKWWSQQKEILLVEFEKIIEQKINECNDTNQERQVLHL